VSDHDCDAPGPSWRELETGYEVQYLGPESEHEDDWLDHGHGTASPDVAAQFVAELLDQGIAEENIRVHELLTVRRLIPDIELRGRALIERAERAEEATRRAAVEV
jgi:hypothetical protein